MRLHLTLSTAASTSRVGQQTGQTTKTCIALLDTHLLVSLYDELPQPEVQVGLVLPLPALADQLLVVWLVVAGLLLGHGDSGKVLPITAAVDNHSL